MRWEVQIQKIKKEDGPDWELMGINRPKDYPKADIYYRRALIDTYDIEYLEDFTKDLTLLKCTWMEKPVLVKGGYDKLTIQVNDLENSEIEDELPNPDELFNTDEQPNT